MQNIRVLVTGATGFLGSHILEALMRMPGVIPVAACRRRDKLPRGFDGEVREGDLLDPLYRRALVGNIDVLCHAGYWASLWGHGERERRHFYEPSLDLLENAMAGGVRRFIMSSSVSIGTPAVSGGRVDDFSPARRTGFWPHLDFLVDLDRHMRANSRRGTQMVTLRLGHFVGVGNRLGLVPALVPRLRTYLVPWLGKGENRLPLVAGQDLGRAFALAATADGLEDYESFNICGSAFPTLREVIEHLASVSDSPLPLYRVPYRAAYLFGRLMETLKPVLPGSSPFLTRSIVHLCENWVCDTGYAQRKLGYRPRQDWRAAMREHLAELAISGYPWPMLRGT